jgi:hypothetical protein
MLKSSLDTHLVALVLKQPKTGRRGKKGRMAQTLRRPLVGVVAAMNLMINTVQKGQN